MSDPIAESSATSPVTDPLPAPGPFYSGRDWWAGLVAGLVALVGYSVTLQPSVGLEDSGEFLTAAYHLGVPHPPGYPIWTVLAWLWQKLIPFGNIAARVNFMSAFFGALAIGLAALLISKSGHVLAGEVGFLRGEKNRRLVDVLVLLSSVAAALMLAFSPVMWSQAIITEVYAFNAFFLFLILALLYRWSFDPSQRRWLYWAAFLWGVSLTNHQTLVLLVIAFPTFIWMTDRRLGRDVLMPILGVVVLATVYLIARPGSLFHAGPFSAVVVLGVGGGAGYWLYRLWKEGPGWMGRWPQVLMIYLAVVAGLSLYGYLYLSASTNPPMNWGHCSEWEGFKHHFTRGQYEKVHTERDLIQLWGQLNMFFDDVQEQFNIIYALLALLALFFYRDLGERDRNWLKFLLVGFLFLGLGFIFLSNPTFEKQKQFVDRVFFLPGHCLFSLWIGYGLILGLGYLVAGTVGDDTPKKIVAGGLIVAVALRVLLAVGAGPRWAIGTGDQILLALLVLISLVCLSMAFAKIVTPMTWGYLLGAFIVCLPVVSWTRSWSSVEQRGHYFGYRFGYLMFQPGGGYPDMDRNAILFGGTDPGRFVPTYMIFVESFAPPRAKTRDPQYPGSAQFDRRDVYIITQNALADSTYMAYIRDHYDHSRPRGDDPSSLQNRSPLYRALFRAAWRTLGRDRVYPPEPIWIPSDRDSQEAFQRYVEELRHRTPQPGESVRLENGRVSVQGVAGIMAINGLLTREIFEKNKQKHSFYVEESYAIPWMYPYLEPFGIIMKLNPEPLPALTPDVVARDTAYWDALTASLRADPRFERDDVAQKTFSKLRSAIGGLYLSRRMVREAEYAFRQARELCPDSPEANFRLAQLLLETRRYDEAVELLKDYQQRDPYNVRIREALLHIEKLRREIEAAGALEEQLAADPGNVALALRLAQAYARAGRLEAFDALVNQLILHPELPEADYLALINLNAQLNRADRVFDLLRQFTQRYPQNALGWFNFAGVQSQRGDCRAAADALRLALQLDRSGQLRQVAGADKRFEACRNTSLFQQLLSGPPAGNEAGNVINLPFRINQ